MARRSKVTFNTKKGKVNFIESLFEEDKDIISFRNVLLYTFGIMFILLISVVLHEKILYNLTSEYELVSLSFLMIISASILFLYILDNLHGFWKIGLIFSMLTIIIPNGIFMRIATQFVMFMWILFVFYKLFGKNKEGKNAIQEKRKKTRRT